MAISLDDIEESGIQTPYFERYLEARGWSFDAETRAGGRQWRRDRDYVFLPAPGSSDASLRFYDAVLTVAATSAHDPGIVLAAIASAAERMLFVRVLEGRRGRSIPIEEGTRIVDATTGLVRVAIERAGFDPAVYMNYVRLAQPTTGGYGLTVFLPRLDGSAAERAFAVPVADEFVQVVLVAEHVSERDPVRVRADVGLSVDQFLRVTRSLASLISGDIGVVEIETTDEGTPDVPRVARLRHEWLPRLLSAEEEAARELQSWQLVPARQLDKPSVHTFEDVTLKGPVVALKRPWVTILTTTPIGERQVRFQLTEESYRAAVTSHREHRAVLAAGTLIVRPRSAELRRVARFEAESDRA